MSDAHKDRLPRVPAQAAEGECLRAILQAIKLRASLAHGSPIADLKAISRLADNALDALSAEGSANTAAADLQALASEDRRVEDMRERAARLMEADAFDAGVRLDPKRHKSLSDWFQEQRAAAIRALPLNPEDQQKADATPTIADPVKEGGRDA